MWITFIILAFGSALLIAPVIVLRILQAQFATSVTMVAMFDDIFLALLASCILVLNMVFMISALVLLRKKQVALESWKRACDAVKLVRGMFTFSSFLVPLCFCRDMVINTTKYCYYCVRYRIQVPAR